MTLKECVGIVAVMFIATTIWAFVKAWAAVPKRERGEGQVILRSDWVSEERVAKRTNGKANVEIKRQ